MGRPERRVILASRAPGLALAGAMALMPGCGRGEPAQPGGAALLTGPRFWTGDPARPWADALVVREGRIAALADKADIPKRAAAGAGVVALPGALALPGLTDAHAHLLDYALARRDADLAGAPTLDETLARVKAFAAEHKGNRWIVGRGWDQTRWPGRAWPDADRLEAAVPGRPCALWRVDGHAVWVNRTALAEAGIDDKTADPPGGSIRRDAAGRPTGILVDAAVGRVSRRIPPAEGAEIERALEAAAAELVSLGLTGVHEMGAAGGSRRVWETMVALAGRGRFPLRVTVYVPPGSRLDADLAAGGPVETGRLRIAGHKLFADGALGSRGARLLDPYADEPASRGLWASEPAALGSEIDATLARGLQPAVHAIGDAANRAVLDAIAAALEAAPDRRGLRPRIEHAQIVAPDDIPRFAALGVVASMQPTHATSDMRWAEDRLGPGRLAGAYAWRAILDAGAPLAFGSDFPVESADPRLGLYAAVTRQDARGQPPGGWLPRQRLSLEQAVAAFTRGAAYAANQEKRLGKLAPGYECDVTVFDRDLFGAPPSSILEAKVVATVIAGEIVWREARSP